MTLNEILLLSMLLTRAQFTFSPVEIAWVNALLEREGQKAKLTASLQVQETEVPDGS